MHGYQQLEHVILTQEVRGRHSLLLNSDGLARASVPAASGRCSSLGAHRSLLSASHGGCRVSVPPPWPVVPTSAMHARVAALVALRRAGPPRGRRLWCGPARGDGAAGSELVSPGDDGGCVAFSREGGARETVRALQRAPARTGRSNTVGSRSPRTFTLIFQQESEYDHGFGWDWAQKSK